MVATWSSETLSLPRHYTATEPTRPRAICTIQSPIRKLNTTLLSALISLCPSRKYAEQCYDRSHSFPFQLATLTPAGVERSRRNKHNTASTLRLHMKFKLSLISRRNIARPLMGADLKHVEYQRDPDSCGVQHEQFSR
jgi:hypothetical protein